MSCDSTPNAHGWLLISFGGGGGRRIVRLIGELDIASAPGFRTVIRRVVADASEVVIDLEGVEFMDGTGLASILECRAACERAHVEFALTAGQGQPRRLFEVTGLLGELPFIRTAA